MLLWFICIFIEDIQIKIEKKDNVNGHARGKIVSLLIRHFFDSLTNLWFLSKDNFRSGHNSFARAGVKTGSAVGRCGLYILTII